MVSIIGFDNPYIRASYIDKLKETKTIVLTDLDGTHATRLGSYQEMQDRAAVRALLEKRRYVAGAVTARTPALTMSSSVYEASCALGFKEPPPHWGMDVSGKRRTYVPLEELPFFNHSLDWDVVAGMGSGVWPRNGHGYLMDREFELLLQYDYIRGQKLESGVEPVAWRDAILLLFLDPKLQWVSDHFSPLESRYNYDRGLTDVAPLPFRIQLGFEGGEGLVRLRRLKELMYLSSLEGNPVALRTAVVDESKPDLGTYTVYLMPWNARKEKMINHLLYSSAQAAALPLGDLRVFYAGDTPTDLRSGLFGSGGSALTFLLATGSPLAPYLIERRPCFGEEPLDFLWESGRWREPRLLPTNEKGVYRFKVRGRKWANTIVIGDERYPNMTPPGSVLAFLEEFA